MAFETWRPPVAPRVGATGMQFEQQVVSSEQGNVDERAEDGIDSLREVWTLSWPAIPDADADEIEAWFDIYGFTQTFKYQVPGRATALQFNFTAFDRNHAAGHLDGITATIRQNFDIEQAEINMQIGVFSLTKNGSNSDLAITEAGTYTTTEITNLAGMRRVTIQHDFDFIAGQSPTSVTVFTQTQIDQHWVDIARHRFLAESKVALFTILGEKEVDPAVAPTDGTLESEAGGDEIIHGILGDKLRQKVVVAGTYAAGSSLATRALVA